MKGPVPATAPGASRPGVAGRRASRWWPGAVLLAVALASRLAVLPLSHEGNMSPDAAHFLNVARCIGRGQGFSNPAAWPAWLMPERLPAPETFKDPGLPFAIAALAPLVGDPFRAGQIVSLLCGLLMAPIVLALGVRITGDRGAAWLAGLLTALSPVLIGASVRVMSESLFTLLLVAAFLAAAPREDRRRPAHDLAAGALLGLAFLTRAQALLALPALLLLALGRAPQGRLLPRAARLLLAAAVVAAPLMVRNLRVFGAPFHGDAASFAVWPFVDPVAFSHSTSRPPEPLPFLASHLPQVLDHTARALARFLRSALARDLLGAVVWLPGLVAGAVIGLARFRTWAFAWLYLVPAVLAMCVVSWNTRYFASTVPFLSLIAGSGTAWLAGRLGAARWPAAGRGAAAAALLAVAALEVGRAREEMGGPVAPEMAAALAESPVIAARLAPGESMMAVTTSYWSWFGDRPSVHLVIADRPEFLAVVRRYRVRWAALPTSRLAELAARFPGGRLPGALVFDHADPERDVTVFAVREPPGPAPSAPDAVHRE